MIIDRLVLKIQNAILNSKKPMFSLDILKQKEYLESFRDPTSLIERSYYQYLCQKSQLPKYMNIIQNLGALLLLPIYYFLYSIQARSICFENHKMNRKLAVFISTTKDASYIPPSLSGEFEPILLQDFNQKRIITKNETPIILEIFKRYWNSPYFCFKIILKIACYATPVNTLKPGAIITFAEFSFTSSALTYYCNKLGLEHINIMHGEKLYNIQDTFVQFNRYYVWDKHYINILTRLRAESSQFIVEKPSVVDLAVEKYLDKKYTLTYYLQNESEDELVNIKNALIGTGIPINKMCIRYHPRVGNKILIASVFDGFMIEDPNKVSLSDSLSITYNAVSLFSSVLYQAYESGINIIIDDESNAEKYLLLKELDYIMLSKPHKLLSQYVI